MRDRGGPFPSFSVRYSARNLPAYRYLPGETPHPITDPDGHSYGVDQTVAGESPEAFCYGVDLYNAGYWWEAHEAWESVWLSITPNSAERHALRGMIQVANAFLKVHMLRAGAVRKLRTDIESCFDAALLHAPGLAIFGFALAPWVEDVYRYNDLVLMEAVHVCRLYPYLSRG